MITVALHPRYWRWARERLHGDAGYWLMLGPVAVWRPIADATR